MNNYLFFLKRILTNTVLLLLSMMIVNSCLVQKQSNGNQQSKKISFYTGDSIQIDRIFLSSFDTDQIDTLSQDFTEIQFVGERVNIQIEGKELYKSGNWYEASYFITDFLLEKRNSEIRLDKDYTSLKYYKEEDCVTDGSGLYYDIVIKNNTDQYIFKMRLYGKKFKGNIWSSCHSKYNAISRMLHPRTEDIVKNVEFFRLSPLNFTFGMYNPKSHEINEITIDSYEVTENLITIRLEE